MIDAERRTALEDRVRAVFPAVRGFAWVPDFKGTRLTFAWRGVEQGERHTYHSTFHLAHDSRADVGAALDHMLLTHRDDVNAKGIVPEALPTT